MTKIAIPQGFKITAQQFEQLATYEQEARLELTASGELIIMSPTGGSAGRKNRRLTQQLGNWTDKNGAGEAFDSSTVFVLPNGARKSPDASWVKLDRWNELTLEQQDGFPPIVPDFVIELVSASDLKNQRYQDLQLKMTSDPAPSYGARERARMQEYIDNGVKLGWLIEPKTKTVEIYRPGKSVEVLNNPKSISGEDILPGFILDLSNIFS
ncbi:MAG: Uma2 family endonuclease [Xenococcaceae cyanobacterium MO_188.B19]|nr:Uma2 family endonuclease [Xenococcaceae cyanobacterium MO_188.B19]